MKLEQTKLIGHEVCVAINDGNIIESGIVHKISKIDGKSCGSINTAQAGPYVQTETSVVQGYVKDQVLTDEWLEDNDVRKEWDGAIWRPAKPNESGQLLPNTRPGGWSYDEIQPGQRLWVEVAEVEPTAEPASDPDTETTKLIDEVVDMVGWDSDEATIRDIVRKQAATRARVSRIVRKEMGL